MTARHQALSIAAVFAIIGFTTVASAQTGRTVRVANPNAPRLMVGSCRNSDSKLAPDAGDAVRENILGVTSERDLAVIPKQDVVNTLQQSGYSTTDAISSADMNALAKTLRSDEYIECTVNKTPAGYQIEASLILARDRNVIQPLGSFEGTKLDQAAGKLSKEFEKAQKVFDPEKNCRLHFRESKNAEADKDVAEGLKQYPKSLWIRLCQLDMYKSLKRPSADILKLAEEISALDPSNKTALRELVGLYDAAGDKDKKVAILMKLRDADPTDAKLGAQIVGELAAAKKFDLAKPLIEKYVADNQGDVLLVQLYFLVLGATNDTKKMVQVGEDMVKMDTSLADEQYFDKMISAYGSDSNYQAAATTAAKATVKFPKNAAFWMTRGNLELRLKQTQQAITSLKKALEIDPKTPGARLLILSALVETQEYDTAYVAMHAALKAGEDANTVGALSLTIGNRLFTIANKTEPKAIPPFQRMLPFVTFADSIAKDASVKGNAKFLIGVSSFFIGSIAFKEAVDAKSCAGSKAANGYFVDAQINLPAGGAANAQTIQQLMPALAQYLPQTEQGIKAFCTPAEGGKKGEAAAPAKKP